MKGDLYMKNKMTRSDLILAVTCVMYWIVVVCTCFVTRDIPVLAIIAGTILTIISIYLLVKY